MLIFFFSVFIADFVTHKWMNLAVFVRSQWFYMVYQITRNLSFFVTVSRLYMDISTILILLIVCLIIDFFTTFFNQEMILLRIMWCCFFVFFPEVSESTPVFFGNLCWVLEFWACGSYILFFYFFIFHIFGLVLDISKDRNVMHGYCVLIICNEILIVS